jgi:hypothetical protein
VLQPLSISQNLLQLDLTHKKRQATSLFLSTTFESPSDISTMSRSLGLFLFLATASVAHTGTHYDFTVSYSMHTCEDSVNTEIRALLHQSIVEIAGPDFNSPVYGHDEVRRNLRTGSSPRELEDYVACDSPCGCVEAECQMQPGQHPYCVDTCGGGNTCSCTRRMEDREPRLLHNGDQCAIWQEDLTYDEMDSILSCEATIYIKTAMAVPFAEEDSCLGDIDQFEATVTILGSH